MTVILFATLCLSLEHYGMSAGLTFFLCWANFVMTILFTLEFTMKLLGLGLTLYCKDKFNILDGLIVGASLFDLAIAGQCSASTDASAVKAVRVARLVRQYLAIS